MKAREKIKKLVNLAILLAFKQTLLLWVSPLIRQQESVPALEEVNNSIEELLLNALIGEVCKGNNIIKELITI